MDGVIHGLLIGSTVAFVAVGYAIIYSILRFINFAHGELMMAGAYLALFFSHLLPLSLFPLALFLAVIATGILGVIIERLAYRPLRRGSRIMMLLSSLAVSLMLQSAVSLIFGSSGQTYALEDVSLTIIGHPLYAREVMMLIMLVVTFSLLSILLSRTQVGIALRAIASNPLKAELMGAPVDRIVSWTFFGASSLAAIAGIYVGFEGGIFPTMGVRYTTWAFAVAVIAGLGSIRGVVIAGLLYGVLLNYAIEFGSSLIADTLSLLIMTAFLLFRPEGMFTIAKRKL